jgi:hypothetical protein
MESEHGATITIGGEEYELILSTRATKDIASRYGGLDALGEKLLQPNSTDAALSEVVWLVVTLANQSIMAHNLRKNNPPRELLTEETVELLTTPYDLIAIKDSILEAMVKGTKRTIESAEVSGDPNPPVE